MDDCDPSPSPARRRKFDELNPPLRFGNRHEWTAIITSLDGEPIDFGARAFGPVVDADSHMWPLRGADGVVRKFLLEPRPSEPDAANVIGSGAPLI